MLILRDVLGFSARETADALDTKPTSVDSVLQRGHKTVDARLPEQNQQAALRSLGDTELREIVDGYIEAWERADIDSVVAMLAEEVTLDMPPYPNWYAGRDAVAAFLDAYPPAEGNRWRVVPTSANGQLAFGHYIWREEANVFVPGEISVLTLRGTQIAGITIFRDPGGTGTLRATGRDRAVTSCEPRTEVLELVVFSVKPGEREALLEGREAAMTAPAERGRPELGGTHRRGSRSPPRDRPPPVRCRPVKGRAEAVI